MHEYNDNRYTSQQKYQLKLAERAGLDISKLANPELSYKQMEVLRTALQEGIDVEAFCHPSIPLEEMQRQIESAEEKQHIIDIAREEYHHKIIKKILFGFITVAIILSSGYLCYANKEFLKAYFNAPKIVLTEQNIELKLSEMFLPMTYIKSYDSQYELKITGDDLLNSVGTHKVSYCQSNGVRESCNHLYVSVVDDIKPQIFLTENKITLQENENFNALQYLDKVIDNCDGNLIENVTVSNYDPNLDTQEIIYSVKDSYGNMGTASLTVTTEKQAPIIINQITPSNQSSNNSSSSTTPPKNETVNNDNSSNSSGYVGKFYSIDDYGTFEACLNACYQEASGGQGCYPKYDDDDICIGYEMTGIR